MFAVLVAVTAWDPAAVGAIYRPEKEIVPTELLPPLIPSTDHVTFVLTTPLIEAVNCSLCPGVNELCSGLTDTVLLGIAPVPLSVTICMVDELLSLNVMYPARVPVHEGLNVTFTVQLDPAASDEAQLLL